MSTTATLFHKIINEDYALPIKAKHKQWLNDLGDQLKSLDVIKQLSIMCQCKILYYVRYHWDDIDKEILGFWDYNFYNWAIAFTQNESTNNPASSTIDNKVNVYRDYIAEPCIRIPETVRVRKTDSSGNPIGDGSLDEHYEEIIPDLMWGNYTKLLHAKKPAKEGLMTYELWSIVFDSTQSVSKLLKKIKKIPFSNYQIVEEDGLIIGRCQDGYSVLSVINFDDMENPIWREGIAKLLKSYHHTINLE